MKIAVLDDYSNVSRKMADWSAVDALGEVVVFDKPFTGEDEAAAALQGFEVIVGMRERTPFPASLLKRLPALKLLITTGMRNLAFDMDAAKDLGITVSGTTSSGYAAAEHAWAIILGLAKRIAPEDADMRSGGWQSGLPIGLNGRRLGIIGLGKLGARAAMVAKAFEMDVVAWSQNLTDERCAEVGGVTRVSLDELMSTSDFVSIHLILSERSRGLLGARELGLMKPTAYLVNTSRGPIVEEAALIDTLVAKRIAGAGLDVYDVEPLPVNHPLRTLPNVLLSPHLGYVIEENYAEMYRQSVENILAWSNGDPKRVLNA
ncbi:MAG: D-2-hydroxyacid dehydrogenase family protein [Rhodospirillales bacterium]